MNDELVFWHYGGFRKNLEQKMLIQFSDRVSVCFFFLIQLVHLVLLLNNLLDLK